MRAEALITETLKLEERRFRTTLERGLAILEEDDQAALKQGQMLDGETAFALYDTYGFPLDLTQDALRSRGIGVDTAAFTDAMEAPARRGARRLGRLRRGGAPRRSGSRCASRSAPRSSSATRPRAPGAWSPRWSATARRSSAPKAGESGAVVLNQTPFYGESGSQVGDTGAISAATA